MNKAYLLILALAACGKHNEVNVLHHEAAAAATYYAPKIDALDQRVQKIFQHGATIPASTPGINEVGARLTEARDMIVQLRGIVGKGPDGKSAIEKQAEAAAKDRNVANLEKLVHDTHTTLERGVTVIDANLQSVESWIAYYDRQALAMPPDPGPGPGQPSPAPGTQPAPGGAPPAAHP